MQGLPDGWSVPFGPSLADAPAWYEIREPLGGPGATAVRTAHHGAGGLGVQADDSHTLDGTGGEAVSFPTGNANRGELRENEVTALQRGGGPTGSASSFVAPAPQEPLGFNTDGDERSYVTPMADASPAIRAGSGTAAVAYDDRNQTANDETHHTLRADGGLRSSDAVAFRPRVKGDATPVLDDQAPALATAQGNMAPHVLAAEANLAGRASPLDPQPDGSRYAGLGDAVTAPVSEWIARRLLAAVRAE